MEIKPEKKSPPPPQHVFGSKFDTFVLPSTQIQYSLTRRKVCRPRKTVVSMNDYVVSNGSIYQIAIAVDLPVVQPGYSVEVLRNQYVKAFQFEILCEAKSPADRTRYAPKIIPSSIRIGDIQAFVDVYEPVGCSVEEQGIVLTQMALMEMSSQEKRNRIIPATHNVKLPNKVVVN